ncbi:FAD-binding protein [Raoultibacter phocaeensis]|uniref:FAD-binding protein n=1 Tax=Raoultibacter phocaeensis TaxID=2479841 RepID=UPI001117FEEB|nr:FAD-binding protein [Raoultibacter phocaeensis]
MSEKTMHNETFETRKSGLSRRAFLGLGAAAVVAGAGLAGCSPSTPADAEAASSKGGSGSSASGSSSAAAWRTAPAAPSEVAEEAECDVLVIGLGHAGSCAARAAAEGGATVCAFEKQELDARSYMSGGQVGHINSELLASQGVPEVDELVFMNDWMLRHNNRPNPGLIRRYAANSGACFDWLFGEYIDDPASVVIRQWPANDAYQEQIGGLRGFIGCAHTGDFMTAALDHCAEVVEQSGGTVYYGTSGYLLITDDAGAVTGAYGEKSDGTYVKVTAMKGVILAGGGFGGNADMLTDLYAESLGLKAEGETLSPGMDQDGSGVALGYWAGGKLDPCMSGMGGNYFYPCDSPSDPAGTAPVLWLNSLGERYCNEGFGSIELAAIPGAKEPSGIIATVFGSNVDDYVYAQVPSHMAIDYAHEASQPSMSGLHEAMEKALAGGAAGSAGADDASGDAAAAGPTADAGGEGEAPAGGGESGGAPAGGGAPGGPGGSTTVYCSDDLATLAGYLGYTGEAVDTFVASVERYNELCDQGRDEDFGKDAHLMIKMEAPYYAYCAEKEIGAPMVTTSGLLVNQDSQVLDQNCNPLPGLYAAGNNSGSRFGYQYTTSISGVSLGIAQTQGYMVGKLVADAQ